MHRARLIEIHEQAWFPSFLRDEITDALRFGLNFLKAYAPIAPLLRSALETTESRTIVDMCSGGGGPWPGLSRMLEGDGEPFHVWLTDKHPSVSTAENGNGAAEKRIGYYPKPVDATDFPRELEGFRTVFTSFHHFSMDEARAIFQNAVDGGRGIGIFEITGRTPVAIGCMLIWALLLFVCTPLIRPFRWSRLFWTYVLPVIPVVLMFDGVVSCLRTYRPQELREIIEKLDAPGYEWQVGERSSAMGLLPISYAIGYPKARLSQTRLLNGRCDLCA